MTRHPFKSCINTTALIIEKISIDVPRYHLSEECNIIYRIAEAYRLREVPHNKNDQYILSETYLIKRWKMFYIYEQNDGEMEQDTKISFYC